MSRRDRSGVLSINPNIMLIGEITAAIEQVAPRGYQEEWDNTGMQVGNRMTECTGVLICVDVTPAIVEEAVSLGCNLIVSHHPLLFKGVKRLTGATPVEVSVMNAVAAGVSIYSCHTAIDNVPGGVSSVMAGMLGIDTMRVLDELPPRNLKLSVMVPRRSAESVRMALFDAGAGSLGNYDCCSFNTDGTGTFQPMPGAHPYVGEEGSIHEEPETRIDMLVPVWLRDKAESALLEVHPYEEPAYEFTALQNGSRHIGAGVIGTLRERMRPSSFVEHVKKTFGSPVARCSAYVTENSDIVISRVALCGGSGGSFIDRAIALGAQAYVTSDVRYHDFVDHRNDILLIDIGHYESEHCTKDIFYQIITRKFVNFAVYKSKLENNPIKYV